MNIERRRAANLALTNWNCLAEQTRQLKLNENLAVDGNGMLRPEYASKVTSLRRQRQETITALLVMGVPAEILALAVN